MVAVSYSRIDAERADLRGTCAVLSGTDACTNSNPGMEIAAQSDVDAIATWKGVRIGSWIGLGAGVVTAGYGVWALVHGGRPASPPRRSSSRIGGWRFGGSAASDRRPRPPQRLRPSAGVSLLGADFGHDAHALS